MNWKQARAAFEPTPMPGLTSNVLPFRRISTEEMADNLNFDLRVIADRIHLMERDLAALIRLRDTKAESLECCLRALGRQS